MDSPVEDWNPTFCIGQHDSSRVRVTPQTLEQAHACNVSDEAIPRVCWQPNHSLV